MKKDRTVDEIGVRDEEVIDLSDEARDRLLEVLADRDARPNEALARAARRHEKMIEKGREID